MDARVYELLNDQINKELYSSYLYLSFADYYEEEGLEGFANWYEIQAKEERDHALIFRNYLHENGCKVKLLAIDQPDKEFTTFLEPLEAALEHEKYVTSLINAIYAAAAEVPCTTSIRRTPRACTPCRPRWLLRNRPQASPSYRAPAHAGAFFRLQRTQVLPEKPCRRREWRSFAFYAVGTERTGMRHGDAHECAPLLRVVEHVGWKPEIQRMLLRGASDE